MARLVGLGDDGAAAALMHDLLEEERTVAVELGEDTLVVLWAPGESTALDTAAIDAGRDVGQTAAFIAELDGEPVEPAPTETDGRFVDARTGSTFDLRGRALDGPLEGGQLEAVTHDDTFWFVWIAFRPDTEVWRPELDPLRTGSSRSPTGVESGTPELRDTAQVGN